MLEKQKKMLNNSRKHGEVGETMTWVVATLIIVIVLAISIYATSILAKKNLDLDVLPKVKDAKTTELLAVKSVSAYFLTHASDEQTVFSYLQKGDNLNEKTGLIAYKIFDNIYDYHGTLDLNPNFWLKIFYSSKRGVIDTGYAPDTSYFSEKCFGYAANKRTIFSYKIDNDKSLNMCLLLYTERLKNEK